MNSNVKTRRHVSGLIRSAFVLAVSMVAVSSSLAAEPVDAPRTETVQFQDLSVSSREGIAQLYSRIHSAAQRVCSASGERDLGHTVAAMQCIRRAEWSAISKLNMPALTAYYGARKGHAQQTVASNR
jgi:UrcA family protein